MQLDLTSGEAAVLAEVLDTTLGELREQIYKSEVAEYKDSLKRREAALVAILQRLGAQTTAS